MSKAKRRRLVLAISSVVASFGGAIVPATLGAPGDIFNLGTLGGTASYNNAGNAINNTGQVAGYSSTTDGSTHAFRYSGTPGSGGAMADLGNLPGGTRSEGYAINDAGQVTGESAQHAFLYTGTPGSGGAMADLGTLPGGGGGRGLAINNAGEVAGQAATRDGTHAFRYSGGAMVDLGTLGGTRSYGHGINEAGQVAGYSRTPGDNYSRHRAFLYTGTPGSGGAMVDLGTLGGTGSEGHAINEAGQVAGFSNPPGEDYFHHAFRYTGTPGAGGAMTDLGTLGGSESHAYAINDAGYVVGQADYSGDGHDVWATLWQIDAANTAVDLDAWLHATNPTLGAYWTLRGASGINNNGLITGTGAYNDGPGGLSDGDRAFILDASSLVALPGWAVNSDGNWSVATNWSGGVPNAAGAVASFGGIINAPRTVTVDAPQTVGAINFDNANAYTLAGASTLTIDGSAINVVSGSHTISAPLSLAGNTTVNVAVGSNLTLSKLQSSAMAVTKTGAGKVAVNGVRAGGLTVSAGEVEVLSSGNTNANASRVANLSVAAGATLDLADNDLIVDGGDYSVIEGKVIAGFNGGNWLGTGITSSAAATDTNFVTALGVVDNSEIGYSEFAGQTGLNGDEILVKHTYYGDTDLGGTINLDDFNQFLFGFNPANAAPQIWLNGDFNYTGSVNLDDFNLFLFGLANQGGTLVSPELFAALSDFVAAEGVDVDLSAVPEPASMTLLALGSMLLTRRRCR